MSLETILLIVLILMLIGVIPTWPHSRSWGYGPSGVIGLVLVILGRSVTAGPDIAHRTDSVSAAGTHRVAEAESP